MEGIIGTASKAKEIDSVANDVNYAVAGDGSVSFMASGEAGYYRLLGIPSQ
ncbi:hypothetical protein BH23CHL2_BH23CHL2_10340 [soil metagenome]